MEDKQKQTYHHHVDNCTNHAALEKVTYRYWPVRHFLPIYLSRALSSRSPKLLEGNNKHHHHVATERNELLNVITQVKVSARCVQPSW